MKLTVKTLKGSHFHISVHADDTIMAVKKCTEDARGKDTYPCGLQLLIHNGKVLEDESTLAESEVSGDGFLVVMLSKPATTTAAGNSAPRPASDPQARPSIALSMSTDSASVAPSANDHSGSYEEAASNLVVGDNLEPSVQHLLDMGVGMWDKEMVIRALEAANNDLERAIDIMYSDLPENTKLDAPFAHPSFDSLVATLASGTPNSAPLNLFPQETVSGAISFDFLRNNQQELGKQNTSLLGLIRENHEEFLELISEPIDDSEGDIFDQAEQDMPAGLTTAEREAIERMVAMGFDRALVMEAFFACDRDEESAVNYLLDNTRSYDEEEEEP